jgi:hypothetical protein
MKKLVRFEFVIRCLGIVAFLAGETACGSGSQSGTGAAPPPLLVLASTSPVTCGELNTSLTLTLINSACDGSSSPVATHSPQPASTASARISSPTGTDLIIANNTGYPNASVYTYAVGSNQYLQANGTLALIGASAIPSLPLAVSGQTAFPLPYMSSARIYFSVNAPLQIGNGMGPTFGADTTQMYDWVEFNYGPNASGQGVLFINTASRHVRLAHHHHSR